MKAKIRTRTPLEFYNLISAINDVYVCEWMSTRAITILGVVGVGGYYTRHLHGDDQGYRK